MKQKIKMIWATAKRAQISDDDLYAVLYRETGKDSMRECTEKELDRVLLSLRTSLGFDNFRGNRVTKKQMWKIRQMESQLGWADNPKRLQSFLRKYYRVDQIEWLTAAQAWRAIESLKKLIEKAAN
ncbi:regulatory protein GemA [Schinkia azotoformans]|uniref:regulatory protein GemA n=1 Tax=Schinkia azotoformans TaxID=1454 RepID=UPI002E23E8FA|nr:regulatory protein GemA [Schinkia azotoformans]